MLFRPLCIREWLYLIQLKSVLNLGLEVYLWKNLCNIRPHSFNEAIFNFILNIACLRLSVRKKKDKGTRGVEKKREKIRTIRSVHHPIPVFIQLFLVHCNFACLNQLRAWYRLALLQRMFSLIAHHHSFARLEDFGDFPKSVIAGILQHLNPKYESFFITCNS